MKSKLNNLILLTISIVCVNLFVLLFPVMSFADFPEKPIRILVAAPPGGGQDSSIRPIEPFFEKYVGANLIFEYNVGGAGELGWTEFMRKRPDGYSLVSLPTPHFIIPPLVKEVSYDPEKVIPLFNISKGVGVIAVHKDSPWNTFEELLEDINKRPQQISVALSPPQGPHHLHLLKIQNEMDFPVITVAYSGGSDSQAGFLGRHFDVWIMNDDIAIRAKDNARFLAVADVERLPSLPDTPTFKELGYNIVQYTMRGVGGIKGMPDYAIDRIVEGAREMFKDPEFIDSLKRQHTDPFFLDSEEFSTFIREETETIKKLFGKAGMLKK